MWSCFIHSCLECFVGSLDEQSQPEWDRLRRATGPSLWQQICCLVWTGAVSGEHTLWCTSCWVLFTVMRRGSTQYDNFCSYTLLFSSNVSGSIERHPPLTWCWPTATHKKPSSAEEAEVFHQRKCSRWWHYGMYVLHLHTTTPATLQCRCTVKMFLPNLLPKMLQSCRNMLKRSYWARTKV